MIFLDLLQSGKKIEVDQIKLYKDQLEMNEREKSSVLEERNRLEAELERVKSQNEQRLNFLISSKLYDKLEADDINELEMFIREILDDVDKEKPDGRYDWHDHRIFLGYL